MSKSSLPPSFGKDPSELKSKDYENWINSFLLEVRDKSSKSDESKKKKAIRDLQHHLNQEMSEMSDEQKKLYYDTALNKIFDLTMGSGANNLNDIKSGIMLMCILLDAPISDKHKTTICAPFANHLRNVNLSLADLELLDLMACAVGKIALNLGSSTPNFVEFEIRRAIELISNERNDVTKRHSAILILRELAHVTPSYFFSHVTIFFENIFISINEPKLREPAISALRSALYVVVERERLASISSHSSQSKISRIDQQIPKCFEICYSEVIKGFEDTVCAGGGVGCTAGTGGTGGTSSQSSSRNDSKQSSKDRDEKIHSSLLILNELFRCSHNSSVILRDSISRELDYLYINLIDSNDTFYLSNYLFSHFDYPTLSSPLHGNVSMVSGSMGGGSNSGGVGVGGGVGSSGAGSIGGGGAGSSSVVSGSGHNLSSSGSSSSAALSLYKSSNYLTKLFRNYSNNEPQNKPLYRIRDLHSVVNYHKENGIAPILSFFHKSKPSSPSTSCRQLITKNFETICAHIKCQLFQKNSIQINQVLLLILPSLAALKTEPFSDSTFVPESINYLLACVKSAALKSLAFISLGLFALAINDQNEQSLDQHLPTIIQQIRHSFPFLKDTNHPHHQHHHHHSSHHHNKKRLVMPDPAVFTCLAFLAQAFGSKVKDDIYVILPAMFQIGLTEPLANSLYNICKYIPALEPDIHEGLLKMLSQIIMEKPMFMKSFGGGAIGAGGASGSESGASPSGGGGGNQSNLVGPSSMLSTSGSESGQYDLETVKLALKVLGRFEFQTQYLIHFVRHCANHYLAHENREIRLEAVHTCCHLLKPFLKPRNSIEKITKDVLSKLLIVGITDCDKYVRYSVLSRLDEQFDYYLAQAENLESLQICLSDEVFEIRELGICIMGRLCSLNPAYVMPFLRKVLLQLLTELEISGISKNMEQSARMLGHLLAATPRLIRPYTEPILKVFLPKLLDPSQAVNTAVMSAIGEQAIVSGLEMRAWFYELFPIILDSIQDISSLQKREIALWTMGRLIENCGFVIEPYWKYPNLLEILFSILKSESTKPSQMIRQETIRVLGLLGAVDPYRHKIRLGVIDLSGESLISYDPNVEQEFNTHEVLANLSNSFEDFYSAQAISTLMQVMKDPNASTQHTMAVQAVAFIFSVLKVRSVPYIQRILPPFINIIRTGEPRIKEFLLQQLGQIISVVKKHIRSYLDDIFKVLRELWNTNSAMQLTLFNVVDQIVIALGGEFRNYVPHLIPHILRVLNHDPSPRKEVTLKLLNALQNFGTNLEDYVHLLIPPIVKHFETSSGPGGVRSSSFSGSTAISSSSSSSSGQDKKDNEIKIAALRTIDTFCDDLKLTEFSSRIIHSIIKVLDDNPNDKKLTTAAMDTLTKFTYQMGLRYRIYIPLVNKILVKHKIHHASYELLINNINDGVDIEELNCDSIFAVRSKQSRRNRDNRNDTGQSAVSTPSSESKRAITLEEIRRAFIQCPRRISKEDWLEWLRKFNIYLINESPSLSLRSCFPIAQACNTVARDLFNPAFLSCWNELTIDQQKELITCIQDALKEQEIPEVTGILLNLAEFLEHIDQGPLLFDVKILAERAIKCRAYAKALHYKEKEFQKGTTTEVLGALITINNKLQQPQAAYGVLMYAMKTCKINDIEVKEKWFEKLNNWDSALAAYKAKYEQNSRDYEPIVGQMRCLEVLSEWEKLYKLAHDTFNEATDQNKQRMARMAANATWGLNKWDEMINYSNYINNDSSDYAFYQAVIKIHHSQYSLAQFYIDKARQLIDTELTTMTGESYNRAYPAMVQVQLMSELEEVIQYKLVPERREMIKQKWWQRLQGCQRVVEDWQKILQVRSLVLSPREDMRSWLKFAKLCDRNNRPDLSFKTIVSLMGVNPNKLFKRRQALPLTYPEVTLKFIDHIWVSGHFKRAFIQLYRYTSALENPAFFQEASFSTTTNAGNELIKSATTSEIDVSLLTINDQLYSNSTSLGLGGGIGGPGLSGPYGPNKANHAAINKLLSRAYLKMAQWQEWMVGFSETSIPTILQSYRQATERDKNWYKAWHSWAFMNFRALKYCKELEPELKKNLEHRMPRRVRQPRPRRRTVSSSNLSQQSPASGVSAAADSASATENDLLNSLPPLGIVGDGMNDRVAPSAGIMPRPGKQPRQQPQQQQQQQQPGPDGRPRARKPKPVAPSAQQQQQRPIGAHPPRPIPLNPKEYCVSAVRGFFQSVALSQGSSLQDTLRILTLWFEDGYDDQVRMALEEGIKNVSIETWLQVIPQLIARIDMPHHSVAKLIHQLLADIGKYHPQALIYPLTVASKSSAHSRSSAATNILHLMRVHSPNLVKQAELVSEELIRIAILWHELWHEGLEEASRLYFGDKNIEGMFETLEPLHQMIERTPMTFKEMTFVQNYGTDLSKAYSYCKKYRATQDQKNLNQAWDIYYHVFRRISRQLPQLTSLELQYVSPKLTECNDLELAVPGSYNPNEELIRISKVEPQLNIITSKQRPRKLTIKGSNGRNYMFLLKGHEDLRQDERVMQLFGLVNTLLNSENSTSHQNLAIQRYAVIPLSPNSGLIGWVPHCDTLHALIRDYRDKRKILLNMEHRLMLRMAPDYDHVMLMKKVEVFEHALDCTPGDDLAKILWLKSPSSEVWFDRRTNYTRSLAVMSMVGYILGLGDRHPSNLMLDRMSGKILHIDFGDCFEVAMTREKYPEKIPFRLTRMLIKAMEVTGLDGTFRITCQSVMFVLRKNKESLMALLEAFVYDPLLNWRLIEAQPKAKTLEKHTDVMLNLPNDTELTMQADNPPIMTLYDDSEQPQLVAALAPGPIQPQQQAPAAGHLMMMGRVQGQANAGAGGAAGVGPSLSSSVLKKSIHHDVERKLTELNLTEGLNSKAVEVINRVRDKLTGRDFDTSTKSLGITVQVDRLIKQATLHENLCQCYIGWCPFW